MFPGGLVFRILGFHCRGLGSVPVQGTEILQAVQHRKGRKEGRKERKKERKKKAREKERKRKLPSVPEVNYWAYTLRKP